MTYWYFSELVVEPAVMDTLSPMTACPKSPDITFT
jgi:hypothetical protein